MTSFPFHIEPLGDRFVLRDDLLPGGTKRRALTHLLKSIPQSRIAYAGTVLGHGALALAHACQDHGKTADIFIACADPDNDPMIARLRDTSATLHIEPPTAIMALFDKAQTWQASAHDTAILPPGFDMPEFSKAMQQALAGLDVSSFTGIWTVSVSGTLTRALQSCFPATPFKTVQVVKSQGGLPAGVTLCTAPEKYHQPARTPPPYPACPYTDAKLWQFAAEQAESRALLWNTAG